MTAFPFAIIATLSCLALWGWPGAILAAAFTFPVAFTIWGVQTIERTKKQNAKAVSKKRTDKEKRFNELHDNLKTLSELADSLSQTPADKRNHKRAAILAERLKDACNDLVYSRIDFDEMGNAADIRQAIAWARTSVETLQREQPDYVNKTLTGVYDIEYVDRRGVQTERRIQLRSIERTAGQIYIWAWCELREDIRTFRAEGIRVLVNAKTGEDIGPEVIPGWLEDRSNVAAE